MDIKKSTIRFTYFTLVALFSFGCNTHQMVNDVATTNLGDDKLNNSALKSSEEIEDPVVTYVDNYVNQYCTYADRHELHGCRSATYGVASTFIYSECSKLYSDTGRINASGITMLASRNSISRIQECESRAKKKIEIRRDTSEKIYSAYVKQAKESDWDILKEFNPVRNYTTLLYCGKAEKNAIEYAQCIVEKNREFKNL